MSEPRPIPRIVHQTWRDREVPAAWALFQASWREHHPDWEHRLWTDRDLRELIRRDYPWFLPIYDGYPEHIKRVEAARYFLLHRHGGIYVDLDFECLRPLDDLLAGHEVVLGLEPAEHRSLRKVVERGLDRIAGNAFLASTPGHPFWEHVGRQLLGAHWEPDPLDATGPCFLTRSLAAYAERERVFLAPSARLYPITSQEARDGLLERPGERARVAAEAFAIHHRAGTWWRDTPIGEGARRRLEPARFVLLEGGEARLTATFDPETGPEEVIGPPAPSASPAPEGEQRWPAAGRDGAPLVSCLMVTRGRADLARRAIRCFQEQTYPARELVIVDYDADDTLARHVEGLADARLVHVRLPPGEPPLGALRNLAVDRARGAFVGPWDDDDLSHRRRLEVQMAALRGLDADACFLARLRLLWLREQRLATSSRRVWEGSMICARDKLPLYPTLRRGEDTPVAQRITRERRVVVLDAPELYAYVCHRANTFAEGHFERFHRTATERHEGTEYVSKMRELLLGLPADVARDLATEVGLSPPSPGRPPAEEAIAPAPRRSTAGRRRGGTARDRAVTLKAHVLRRDPAPLQRCSGDPECPVEAWDLLCPRGFAATWNGGPRAEDIALNLDEGGADPPFVQSVEGGGVLTFHAGYQVQIEGDRALWLRGPVNRPKDGLSPRERLVDASVLPCTVTIAWRLTRADETVRFEAGEPFCTIALHPGGRAGGPALEVVPMAVDLTEYEELFAGLGDDEEGGDEDAAPARDPSSLDAASGIPRA